MRPLANVSNNHFHLLLFYTLCKKKSVENVDVVLMTRNFALSWIASSSLKFGRKFISIMEFYANYSTRKIFFKHEASSTFRRLLLIWINVKKVFCHEKKLLWVIKNWLGRKFKVHLSIFYLEYKVCNLCDTLFFH